MIAPLRPGVTLAQANGPVIETERLLLRQWQSRDMAPYTAMLSDPGTARFITVDGKPVIDEMTGWRHATLGAAWRRHVRSRGEIVRQIRRPRRAVEAAGLARL